MTGMKLITKEDGRLVLFNEAEFNSLCSYLADGESLYSEFPQVLSMYDETRNKGAEYVRKVIELGPGYIKAEAKEKLEEAFLKDIIVGKARRAELIEEMLEEIPADLIQGVTDIHNRLTRLQRSGFPSIPASELTISEGPEGVTVTLDRERIQEGFRLANEVEVSKEKVEDLKKYEELVRGLYDLKKKGYRLEQPFDVMNGAALPSPIDRALSLSEENLDNYFELENLLTIL